MWSIRAYCILKYLFHLSEEKNIDVTSIILLLCINFIQQIICKHLLQRILKLNPTWEPHLPDLDLDLDSLESLSGKHEYHDLFVIAKKIPFLNIAIFRGTTKYHLSPLEQKAFAGAFSQGYWSIKINLINFQIYLSYSFLFWRISQHFVES